MSATGKLWAVPKQPCRSNGFTLIEMLVTLAILALVTGLAFPAVERAVAASRLRAAAVGTQALLVQARLGAIRLDRPVTVRLTANASTLAADGVGDPVMLESAGQFTLSPGPIVFHPDGSATPGTVIVVTPNATHRFDVDGTTGTTTAS
jgi:prepilin-type N-terminal cleavage/methylation domain-containing protein